MANESRWQPLVKTTQSGKSLYVCTICGRTSTSPDESCPTFELYGQHMQCSEIEERTCYPAHRIDESDIHRSVGEAIDRAIGIVGHLDVIASDPLRVAKLAYDGYAEELGRWGLDDKGVIVVGGRFHGKEWALFVHTSEDNCKQCIPPTEKEPNQ